MAFLICSYQHRKLQHEECFQKSPKGNRFNISFSEIVFEFEIHVEENFLAKGQILNLQL